MPRRGFTIMEILVVVAVVILLLSILVVALGQAMQTAQGANTQVLLTSMKQGIIRFREDIGYYPPVLGHANPGNANDYRTLWSPPDPDANNYRDLAPQWSSVTSVADYLVGWDKHQHDGYGVSTYGSDAGSWQEETPPTGIRAPGFDGVWGATVYGAADGSLGARMRSPNESIDQGRVYGPYFELKDERLLGSINGEIDPQTGRLRVFFPGDGGYRAEDPKVVVDYWGSAISYFRRVYPAGALKQSFRALDRTGDGITDRVPTLSDAFGLRPFSIEPDAAADGLADFSPAGDTSTTYVLNSAEFALLSAGPDRRIDPMVRVDVDEFNRDNIVEVGP